MKISQPNNQLTTLKSNQPAGKVADSNQISTPVAADPLDHVSDDGVSSIDNKPNTIQRPTPWQDKLATVACAGAAGATLFNIGSAIAGAPTLLAGLGTAGAALATGVAAWLLADLGSGLFHHTVDNYPTVKTPLIGKIAAEFQIHHHRTQDLHDFSFLSNTANAGRFLWAPLAAVAAVNPHPVIQAGALAFLGAGWLAQGSHRWTHGDKDHPNPKIATVLQNLGVVQKPENHRIHHRMPWSTNYCIVNGANNGWLSKLDVFPRWEKLVHKVTGAEPHSWNDPGVKAYSQASWSSREERDAAREALLADQAANRRVFAAKAREEYKELKQHFGHE